MDAFEAIQNRHTVRNFTGEEIPKESLEKIVDAGRLAASGNNLQPWDFIIITNKDIFAYFAQSTDWVTKAAAVIAVVMDPSSRWWVEDGAAAVQNILIAATALGYGGCWLEGVTIEREAEYKILLNIPQRKRLFTLVPLGIPADIPKKEKKSFDQVIHWEKF